MKQEDVHAEALRNAARFLDWAPWQLEGLDCGWLSFEGEGWIKHGRLVLTKVGDRRLEPPAYFNLNALLRELRAPQQLSLFA